MSTQGYWAECEEFRLPVTNDKRPPGICMIHVRGFFYADTMGQTRMETLRRTHQKLKENIRFYLSIGADLPPLHTSDMVPRDYQKKENTSLIFIALDDIGCGYVSDIMAEQMKAAG